MHSIGRMVKATVERCRLNKDRRTKCSHGELTSVPCQASCWIATGVIALSFKQATASPHRRTAASTRPQHNLTYSKRQNGERVRALRLRCIVDADICSWAPFIGLLVTVIFCGAAWFLAPKGENQTYVRPYFSKIPALSISCGRTTVARLDCSSTLRHSLTDSALWHLRTQSQTDKPNNSIWRSTLVLSAAAMYLMWAITFLAQLHPLISPVRNDLRPEYNQG